MISSARRQLLSVRVFNSLAIIMSGKQQQKGGGDVCANPGCSKIGGGFKRCERCQRVKYCSGKCSKAHWKNGHKKQYKSWSAQDARDAARGSGAGEGAGAGAGAIAEPPSMKASNTPECPICLDIVVDPIRPCVEQPSHVFCRACIHSMEQKRRLPIGSHLPFVSRQVAVSSSSVRPIL